MASSPAFSADASIHLDGPGWMAERRAEAFARWDASTMPSESEEIWRYSRIGELDLEAFFPAPAGVAEVEPGSVAYGETFAGTAGLVWTHDGQVTSVDLGGVLVSKGVVVAPVGARAAGGASSIAPGDVERADEVARRLLGTIAHSEDAVGDLAEAFVHDVTVISVPDGVVVEEPIVVVNWVSGTGSAGSASLAAFPRTLVAVGESARATVVEIIASPTWGPLRTRLLVVPVTEMSVGANGHLDYLSLQDLGPHDWEIAHQASAVERDARFTSFTVALGGDYARVRTDSHAVGIGSETRLLAAYFGTGTQMHDFRTLQDHEAPRTTSDLFFKGAVADRAQSVYSGLIRVRKGAVKSRAFQENRNLVLSEGARAESVPNLDICENDVRCSHASAVGPVDPDQRYYLESRGVPPEEAEQLVVEGFFEDIVGRAPDVAGVRALVHRKVAAKLGEKF